MLYDADTLLWAPMAVGRLPTGGGLRTVLCQDINARAETTAVDADYETPPPHLRVFCARPSAGS